MYKQLNGTLAQDIIQYRNQQQMNKQAAIPIKNMKYDSINTLKYTNPPYNIQQNITEFQQQKQSLTLAVQKQHIYYVIENKRNQINEINNNKNNKKNNRKKWGNFYVIYENKSTSITLGPDYWCFIPAFICFLSVSIAITILVINNTTSIVNRIFCFVVCFGQIFAYILVAMSNPGVVQQKQEQQFSIENINKNKQQQKFCNKCGYRVPKSSYHCRDCDICIKGYDHHCPWTSKCIGQNNLKRFYFFLCMTPLFMVYISVAFIMIMGQQTQAFRIQNIRKLFEYQFDLFL